jgi:hypothetical protein
VSLTYPNVDFWSALKDGHVANAKGWNAPLFVVDAGQISIPSGNLYCFDPLTYDDNWAQLNIQVPPGSYPVKITYADLSDDDDAEHYREAYATILIDPATSEATRRIITPSGKGLEVAPEAEFGKGEGFTVDFAAACIADGNLFQHIDETAESFDGLKGEHFSDAWFDLMQDSNHIFTGVANITIPAWSADASVILVHTGWGDGSFPIIGGYDINGRLVRVHIDFEVVGPNEERTFD